MQSWTETPKTSRLLLWDHPSDSEMRKLEHHKHGTTLRSWLTHQRDGTVQATLQMCRTKVKLTHTSKNKTNLDQASSNKPIIHSTNQSPSMRSTPTTSKPRRWRPPELEPRQISTISTEKTTNPMNTETPSSRSWDLPSMREESTPSQQLLKTTSHLQWRPAIQPRTGNFRTLRPQLTCQDLMPTHSTTSHRTRVRSLTSFWVD